MSAGGLRPDPSKIEAVQGFPCPLSSQELKSFLGLAGYYRRFVAGFSQIVAPLFALQRKNVEFQWTIDCQKAFDMLKQRLTTAPVLSYSLFEQPFLLATDASENVLGAVHSKIVYRWAGNSSGIRKQSSA